MNFGRSLNRVIMLVSLLPIGALAACQAETRNAPSRPVAVSGEAQIGGPFELVNQDGQTVTDASFRGRPMLIYFGFTYCPDICPTALQQMTAALSKVDPKGEKIQPIFISVDPERDTPERLKLYVTNAGFPEGLIGLTGSAAQIETVKEAYKVYAAKAQDGGGADDYTVDHSSIIYLMGPDGKFVDVFTHTSTPEDMKKRLQEYLETL